MLRKHFYKEVDVKVWDITRRWSCYLGWFDSIRYTVIILVVFFSDNVLHSGNDSEACLMVCTFCVTIMCFNL